MDLQWMKSDMQSLNNLLKCTEVMWEFETLGRKGNFFYINYYSKKINNIISLLLNLILLYRELTVGTY